MHCRLAKLDSRQCFFIPIWQSHFEIITFFICNQPYDPAFPEIKSFT